MFITVVRETPACLCCFFQVILVVLIFLNVVLCFRACKINTRNTSWFLYGITGSKLNTWKNIPISVNRVKFWPLKSQADLFWQYLSWIEGIPAKMVIFLLCKTRSETQARCREELKTNWQTKAKGAPLLYLYNQNAAMQAWGTVCNNT